MIINHQHSLWIPWKKLYFHLTLSSSYICCFCTGFLFNTLLLILHYNHVMSALGFKRRLLLLGPGVLWSQYALCSDTHSCIWLQRLSCPLFSWLNICTFWQRNRIHVSVYGSVECFKHFYLRMYFWNRGMCMSLLLNPGVYFVSTCPDFRSN